MTFEWHEDVAQHLAKLKIRALYQSPYSPVLVDEQLFPSVGEWTIDSDGKACLLVKKRVNLPGTPVGSEKFFEIDLLGTCEDQAPICRFQVLFRNSDNVAPPGVIQGRFGAIIEGPEPFVDSRPATQVAHGVTFGDGPLSDAYVAAETLLGDQQELAIDFIVAFGIHSSQILYDEILMPNGLTDEYETEPLLEPIVDRLSWAPNVERDYFALMSEPRDEYDTFGYRKDPNESGPDERFGCHAEPRLIYNINGTGVACVRAELLRVHSRYPFHVELPEGYLEVPDPRAIYFDGPLSWHSRNRLGRPDRYASEVERHRFREGVLGMKAPRSEWVGSTVPELAWYGHDWWAKLQCIELGYKQMNTMHDPNYSIERGGYDTPYLYIMRSLLRGAKLLTECHRVVKREGWSRHEAAFRTHLQKVWSWVATFWKPKLYGLVPRRQDEQVPGHEGEPIIPAWQIIHLYSALYAWKDLGSQYAREVAQDLGAALLDAYVWKPSGEWWMRKIILAAQHNVGWEPHPSLDALIVWPYSSLKLIWQKGSMLGFTGPQQAKAKAICMDLRQRFQGLDGPGWVENISEWGCGDYE